MNERAKKKAGLRRPFLLPWCPRRDSNPHDFRRYHLKVVRLPIPPRGPETAARLRRAIETYSGTFGVAGCSPVAAGCSVGTAPGESGWAGASVSVTLSGALRTWTT